MLKNYGVEVQLHVFLTSVTDGGERLTACPVSLTRKKNWYRL